MTAFRLATAALGLLATLALGGCYQPDGGWMKTSGRGFTYISTPMQPMTVAVVDTRTEEAFFAMDIPPGKQLTFNFLEGGGDDPVYTPNRMVWAVWDAGTSIGHLDNQITAPPYSCCRIDVSIRKAPEWSDEDPAVRLRTDQLADRPPYFTPAGGKLPDPASRFVYDK
ncbi:MAG: hypothetical protein KF724_07085 [Phycisphaeraceae bacterium]|nr:hypothetical protein [Phycisphaeraceae bacterium]